MASAKEKDYAKIAAQKMHRAAEVKRFPRILVYSRNKKGKTTFSNSAGTERTLIIDPEHGTDEMKESNPHVWPVETWGDLDDVTDFLRFVNRCPKCTPSHPFSWVALDGLTKMSNMALKHVMKLQEDRSLDRIPGLVVQRDYGKSGELMKTLLDRYHKMPMGVVLTAQERTNEPYDDSEDEDSEEADISYVPDLPKGVRGVANSLVDVIGRIYVVKLESGKAERRLWIAESMKYDTGYRSEFVLPDMVRNPTIPKLVRLMRTGKVTAAKKTAAKNPG